jgi:hypothetical protein
MEESDVRMVNTYRSAKEHRGEKEEITKLKNDVRITYSESEDERSI